ncbi:hypothetical protein WDZ92_42905, partial [Nostoc sp. NIES-2111]
MALASLGPLPGVTRHAGSFAGDAEGYRRSLRGDRRRSPAWPPLSAAWPKAREPAMRWPDLLRLAPAHP